MNKINDGVYSITGYTRAYLIDGDDGVTLIDTGLPKKEGAVYEGLASIGRTVADLKAIVITHGHTDHFGSAAVIKAESDAHLVCSEIDAPVVRGEQPTPLPPISDKVTFLKPILKRLPSPTGVPVDEEASGDDRISVAPDLQTIQTPGHTPGHMSLLLERSGGILFVGDAATADKSGVVGRGWMNMKTDTFDASLRKIASLGFETAYFGHSKPIVSGASSAFERFVETI